MFTEPKFLLSKTDTEAKMPFKMDINHTGYILSSIEEVIINPKSFQVIRTGIKVDDIIKGAWISVLPDKELLDVYNISPLNQYYDNTFREEIKIKLYNFSDTLYLIKKGSHIASIAFMPLLTMEPIWNE
jgi:hypothetical protein